MEALAAEATHEHDELLVLLHLLAHALDLLGHLSKPWLASAPWRRGRVRIVLIGGGGRGASGGARQG
jgi:hypothetical protein